MTGADYDNSRFGLARVEVLGRTDRIEPRRLAMLNRLPDYFVAQGFEPDLYFREPLGAASGSLEEITLVLGARVASADVGLAAWAAMTAVAGWVPERIRLDHPDADRSVLQPFVSLCLYAGDGVRLTIASITTDGALYRFIHPALHA